MYFQHNNHDRSNADFNIMQYGLRDCAPSFRVYHKRVQNYLIHYVYSGKGTYNVNGKEYVITKNQAFVSFPGQEIWYTSDKDDPFTYRWIEFYGDMAFELLRSASLSVENPIFIDSSPFEVGERLKKITEADNASSYKLTGMFWLFANALVKGNGKTMDNGEVLFKNALSYIHANVDKPTTVEEVAKNIGVTRGYLTKIFSKFIDLSPKQYILRYHMNEVRSLLVGTDMTMGEIASATGYEDGVVLSKAFARLYGMSPSEYRKENKIK